MKRILVLVMIIALLSVFYLSAAGMENLYDMVVPTEREELVISGDLANDVVLDIDIPVGGALGADIGLEADYFLLSQTLDSNILLDAEASFRLGTTTTQLRVATNQTNAYRQYGLDLNGMEGFWEVGGTGSVSFSSAGTGQLDLALDPTVGIGVGRSRALFNIFRAELIMKWLGVTPTENKVRAAAEIFDKAGELLNRYSDNDAELVRDYWQQLANAMGVPNRVVDIIIIGNSQEYAYELNRYGRMVHGTELMIYLNIDTELHTSWFTPFSLDAVLGVEGTYSDFLLDNMLFYQAGGELTSGLVNNVFSTALNATGYAVYLPDDYHWWADATVAAGLAFGNATTFTLALNGGVNYMLTPNFTVFGDLGISLVGGIDLEVGGSYRLW